MKKLKIILIVIIVVLLIAIGIKAQIESALKQLRNMPIENVDLSKIPDGTYTGSYKVFPVAAVVKVTVLGHEIVTIDLIKHENGQGSDAESIPAWSLRHRHWKLIPCPALLIAAR